MTSPVRIDASTAHGSECPTDAVLWVTRFAVAAGRVISGWSSYEVRSSTRYARMSTRVAMWGAAPPVYQARMRAGTCESC